MLNPRISGLKIWPVFGMPGLQCLVAALHYDNSFVAAVWLVGRIVSVTDCTVM